MPNNVPSSNGDAGHGDLESFMLSTLASETSPDRNSDTTNDENATNQPVDKQEGEEDKAEQTQETPDSEEKSDEEVEEDVEQPSPIKIGEREFATTEDALKEATRIIGRNAQLAGDTKRYKNEAQEYKTKYEEALRVNGEWAKFYENQKKGTVEDQEEFEEKPRKNFDPDEVATKAAKAAAAEIRADQERERVNQIMLAELKEIMAVSNYDDVSDTIELLSDKINPLSGKYYTPKEAYDFACRYNGVDNLLDAKQQTKSVQAPKKIVKQVVTSAAARPAAVRNTPQHTDTNRDTFADNVLSEAFPY